MAKEVSVRSNDAWGLARPKTHRRLISGRRPLPADGFLETVTVPGTLERGGTHLRLIPHSLILFSNVL